MRKGRAVNLAEYQKMALETQVTKDLAEARTVSLFGLAGEIGSLLAELKKKRRDGQAYTGFTFHLVEELGDILWYVADLASQVGVVLPNPDPVETSLDAREACLDEVTLALQADAHILGQLLRPGLPPSSPGVIDSAVRAVIHNLAAAAHAAGSNIIHVGQANLKKIRGRWIGDPDTPATQFDLDHYEEEQLPRNLMIEFRERGESPRQKVIMRVQNITVGDRLTDNSWQDDGYRYHDIFHLAYAAVLGWSPVTRSLFKCKRKSKARVDEVEDGARAQITEEIIALQIYGRAREHSLFAGLKRIDHDLLTMIRRLVKGMEVEQCDLWEWELAILRGFAVFRDLIEHRGGLVRIDADRRLIELAN